MTGNDEMTLQPKASLDELAAARRIELARDWLKPRQVSTLITNEVADERELVTLRRRESHLLGAWVPSERCYRYPPWQFRADGQPVPQLKEILHLLRGSGGMASADGRTSGWEEVQWFLVPHVLLDGHSPAEVLNIDPDRVLEIVTIQFVTDSNAGGF